MVLYLIPLKWLLFFNRREMRGKDNYMNSGKTTTTTDEKTPTITRKIGNTTFDIHVHFSETSKETFTDKVLRLIKNDAHAETAQKQM